MWMESNGGHITMWSFSKPELLQNPGPVHVDFSVTDFAAANSPLRWSLRSWKFFANCHLERLGGPKRDMVFVTPLAPMAQKPHTHTHHIVWQSLPGSHRHGNTYAPFFGGTFQVLVPSFPRNVPKPLNARPLCVKNHLLRRWKIGFAITLEQPWPWPPSWALVGPRHPAKGRYNRNT